MKKAVFYQGSLFLVPDEFDCFEAFVEDVKAHPLQVLVLLHEKECLAPYFIEEYCEIKTVMFQDLDKLIEVDVEVMKKADYEKMLLKKMNDLRLNDASFDRLRQSMTLDGTFLREYQKSCYHEAICEFWQQFELKEQYLRESMSEQCEQNDDLRMMFQIYCGIQYNQIRVYLRKIKDKHVLMMTCLADSLVQILIDGILHQAPLSLRKHWDFYGFLPKNIYTYTAFREEYDASDMSCALKVEKNEFDESKYMVEFEIQPHPNFALACEENYLYVCSILGENMFHAVIHDFKWTESTERTGISSQAFYQQVMSSLNPRLLIQLAGHMHQIGLRLKKQDSFSERSFDQHIMTRCIECTDWFILEKPSLDINELQMEMNIAFSTLVFTLRDDEELHLQHKHILLDLMKFLVENTHMEIIDYCISNNRIDVDFMNFDPSTMFNTLRNNAPVFEKYDCRYDEYTADEVLRYEISYQMKKKKLNFTQLH